MVWKKCEYFLTKSIMARLLGLFYDYSPNNKLLSAKSHDFGKNLNSMYVELSNPNTFVQSLLKLGSFLHGKTIEFLDNPTNYPPVTLAL